MVIYVAINTTANFEAQSLHASESLVYSYSKLLIKGQLKFIQAEVFGEQDPLVKLMVNKISKTVF